ncbi:MAG: hypothetical protein DHS20C16_07290 [Phycisphaerae bacterium]|nr:MAG: hypothetical protein DHS20C16_07290 [Phycisphaerae bacterium]
MQSQTTATLTTVLSDVLADLAFMFCDGGDYCEQPSESWLETSIGYSGGVSGELNLICTRTFAVQLAENLLGFEAGEEVSNQESNDAVREFMNVICGQFVTAAHGTEDVFNLTIPSVSELEDEPFVEGSGDEIAQLSVDGQWLQLRHVQQQSA